MSRSHRRHTQTVFAPLCCLVTLATVLSAARAADESVQWRLWEHELTARRAHEDHYRQVQLDVEFTGPNAETFRVPGFWDGGESFRIRTAFRTPGTWTWRTTGSDTSDAGLHQVSGRIEVKRYAGKEPLFRHGMLEVSPNNRYLQHADGTPFLWMGDTAWNVSWYANDDDWREYVRKRAAQKFNVLQLHVTATKSASERPAGLPRPFSENGSPDPDYWRELDERVGFANEQGLVVVLVGIGQARSNAADRPEDGPEFARFVSGRFSGRFAILSPSMDRPYDELNDRMGRYLARVAPQLIIQHPGTDFPAAQKYHDAEYTDFSAFQSGHHRGVFAKTYGAARTWTLDLWNRQPTKPVINIEAMYDGCGGNHGPAWREQDARKLGWITWLSGSRGYTYGAGDVQPKVPNGSGGVWRFSSDPDAFDYWRKCLDWPSARQMTLLRNFFDGIEWWKLEPSPQLIMNQADDETRKMAASRTASGDLLVAYLPDNPAVELDLRGLARPASAKWFNSIDGTWQPVELPTGDRALFTRPDGWEDAVLLLEASRDLAGKR